MSNKVAPNTVTPQSAKQQPALVEKEKRPIDPRIMNGPIVERECTDILFLLLFIASFCVMWWIASTGYADGKPERLVAAYDPDRKACALDYPDYPYIYFPILLPDYYNHTVCVKECPSSSQPLVLQCQPNSIVPSCAKNCGNFNFDQISTLTDFPPSEMFDASKLFCIYETEVYIQRICFPSNAIQYLNQTSNFSQMADVNRMSAWLQDLHTAWGMILGSFFIAFFFGICYMVFVRFFSGVIVWIAIIGYFIALIILAAFCLDQSQQYKKYTCLQTIQFNQASLPKVQIPTIKLMPPIQLRHLKYYHIVFLPFGDYQLLASSVCSTKSSWPLQSSNQQLYSLRTIFQLSQFQSQSLAGLAFFGFGGSLQQYNKFLSYVVSLGDVEGQGTTPFATVTWDERTRNMFWYWVFAGLWKNAFLQALCCFIIASTCVIWYFSQGSGQGGHLPISTSIFRAFRYHLGSLAFGSLILAIVQFIRIILEYVRAQMKSMGGGENKFTKCLIDCLRCYMAYFERFIRFLTRNTYIQVLQIIAITGKNFCSAAKEAFETIWANSMRFTLIGGIGAIFNLIGKLLITITTVMIAYLVFIKADYYVETLFSPILPTVIVFIIAYTVAMLFMSIYGMACDTVLMCFIYDEDLNKQTGGGSAQHCPQPLREFFEQNVHK